MKKQFKEEVSNSKDAFKEKCNDSRRSNKTRRKNNSSQRRAPRNDPKWYSKNPQMLYDSANLSYFNPAGEDLPWSDLAGYDGSSEGSLSSHKSLTQDANTANNMQFATVGANVAHSDNYTVPGVMGIYFLPSFGVSTSKASPVNAAALDNYSFLRDKNSGAKNIEASDTFMYYLAADSLYMLWNWGARIYKYIRTYSNNNWYLPEGFAKIDGIDLTDFTSKLSDFRGFLNYAAGRIAAFAIPAKYSLMTRHSWLVSNIWADSEQPKAQFYMYKPYYLWRYDWVNNQLVPEVISVSTVEDYMNLMNSLIENMYSIDDVGIMSGDTQKAYGNDIYTLSAIKPDDAIVPTFNRDVLMQIHNSHFLNIEEWFDNAITQDPDNRAIIWNPLIKTTTAYLPKQIILNAPNFDVKPEENIEITRNITMCRFRTVSSDPKFINVHIETCGSEIFLQMAMVVFKRQPDGGRLKSLVVRDVHQVIYQTNYVPVDNAEALLSRFVDQGSINGFVNESLTNANFIRALLKPVVNLQLVTEANDAQMRALYAQFDWAPLQIMIERRVQIGVNTGGSIVDSRSSVDYKFVGYVGDLANYTCVDADRVKNMHLAALMSELDVPYTSNF